MIVEGLVEVSLATAVAIEAAILDALGIVLDPAWLTGVSVRVDVYGMHLWRMLYLSLPTPVYASAVVVVNFGLVVLGVTLVRRIIKGAGQWLRFFR